MAASLESWDTMSQLQHARRRAITATAVILAALVVVGLLAVKLWPDSGSPSKDAPKGPDLTWESVLSGIELPVSRSAGPTTTSNGRSLGFQRSELGAALAAVHLTYRTIPEAGSDVFTPTIREQVIGDNAETMLAYVEQQYESDRVKQGVAAGRPLAPGAGRPLAYQVTNFTEQQADVTLFAGFTTDATKFFAFSLQVRWDNGDWRLVAPRDGNLGNQLTQVSAIPNDVVNLVQGR